MDRKLTEWTKIGGGKPKEVDVEVYTSAVGVACCCDISTDPSRVLIGQDCSVCHASRIALNDGGRTQLARCARNRRLGVDEGEAADGNEEERRMHYYNDVCFAEF